MDSKFKAGDVLKFEDGLRGIVATVYPQATNSNEYLYDLWTCYKSAVDWDCWSESELVDKVKIIDHIDISSVVGGKEEKKKWEVTDDDLPLILESLKEVGIDVKCDDSKDRLREDAEEESGDPVKKSLKESLDKINSSFSNFAGYDDLVLQVKVGADQIDRVQIGEDTIEFKTVDKNIRELQRENESLKEEIDILKKKIEQHENDNDIWRQGWYDCLKSLGYYLNS